MRRAATTQHHRRRSQNQATSCAKKKALPGAGAAPSGEGALSGTGIALLFCLAVILGLYSLFFYRYDSRILVERPGFESLKVHFLTIDFLTKKSEKKLENEASFSCCYSRK
jgi:hypothetical protein